MPSTAARPLPPQPARLPPLRETVALLIAASRPLYLPTSLLPAVAGGLVALQADRVDWWLAPLAVVALLVLHMAVDLSNEVEDAAAGVDTDHSTGNSETFKSGLLPVSLGRRVAALEVALAFALGLVLCALQTWWLLPYGLAGIAAGYGYTVGPRPWKYVGLGDAMIIPAMGPLLTQGAYTALTGDPFDAEAFWLGLAPGLSIAAVLAGNNLQDLVTDRAAGIRTLSGRLGFAGARGLYLALLLGGLLTPVVLVIVGLWSWPLLLAPLLVAPLAAQRVRQARSATGEHDPALQALAPETAKLHLAFSLALILGVVLAAVL
jgi:1,4-dihydroxy-2-naphthoate octaprenyltransferase